MVTKGGSRTLKDLIFTLEIDEQNETALSLPYIFSNIVPLHSIYFGTKSVSCKDININYTTTSHIRIGTSLAKELHLPFAAQMHVFIKENNIILGPLIGIFTAGFTDSTENPIGGRSTIFADFIAPSGDAHPFIFLFGGQHINWEEKTIHGYFYHENEWKQFDVPFPNVIYDRLPNRKAELYRPIMQIKKRLQTEFSIPLFNPGFFNKWNIYRVLILDKIAATLLPETERFQNFDQIEGFLSRHDNVYMKPIHGSFGNGIHQIHYSRKDNMYYCRYRDENTNKLRKYRSLEVLINHLLQGYDLNTFLVQQGIPLLRINDQAVDFRIHTNKNRAGVWTVSTMVAKLGGKGSVTTHVRSGGEIKLLHEIFEDEQICRRVTNMLANAALYISGLIDKHVQGHIGEIGFDLGLDKNGHIWLFEANSKPGRTVFQNEKLQSSNALTKQLFCEYAIYLTERFSSPIK